MNHLESTICKLTHNAHAIRCLMHTISSEQSVWKPEPKTWSMLDVMEHVYNEERIDFRLHIKEILNDPPLAWGSLPGAEYIKVDDICKALNGFLAEREASIRWLRGLPACTDWDVTTRVTFGPEKQEYILKAGDVLVSWVAHDFLHIRQMNELLYAWNALHAAPYSVEYAGKW